MRRNHGDDCKCICCDPPEPGPSHLCGDLPAHIATFIAITGADEATARHELHKSFWRMNHAVCAYLGDRLVHEPHDALAEMEMVAVFGRRLKPYIALPQGEATPLQERLGLEAPSIEASTARRLLEACRWDEEAAVQLFQGAFTPKMRTTMQGAVDDPDNTPGESSEDEPAGPSSGQAGLQGQQRLSRWDADAAVEPYGKAYHAFRSGDFENAARFYMSALKIGGPRASLYAELAGALFKAGDFPAAQNACANCLRFDAAHPLGLMFAAETSVQLAEEGWGLHLLTEAVEKYEAVIARAPLEAREGLRKRMARCEGLINERVPVGARAPLKEAYSQLTTDDLEDSILNASKAFQEGLEDPGTYHIFQCIRAGLNKNVKSALENMVRQPEWSINR